MLVRHTLDVTCAFVRYSVTYQFNRQYPKFKYVAKITHIKYGNSNNAAGFEIL